MCLFTCCVAALCHSLRQGTIKGIGGSALLSEATPFLGYDDMLALHASGVLRHCIVRRLNGDRTAFRSFPSQGIDVAPLSALDM